MKIQRRALPDAASSVLILLTIGAAAVLWAEHGETYRRIIQEDGPVEWMTFWAFALAGGLALGTLIRQPVRHRPLRTLYLLAFGLGCLGIALEEISWGQRIIGYRPPETFLVANFQQELNLHNLADTDTRKAMLIGLLVSFGILFPLVGWLPLTARWLDTVSIPAPSPAIIPGFAALTLLYANYPLESTGEWVELGAGIGFVFAAASYLERASPPARLAIGTLPLALGALTPLLLVAAPDPELVAMAEAETQALAADLRDRRLRSRCGVHKRVYTFIEEYGAGDLTKGAWGQLKAPTDAEAIRRRYFLDPWNLPYWIRHACSDGRTTALFVYSFGPNRRRDSTPRAVLADDIGRYASGAPGPAAR